MATATEIQELVEVMTTPEELRTTRVLLIGAGAVAFGIIALATALFLLVQ